MSQSILSVVIIAAVVSPSLAHASVLAGFGDKVKSIFLTEKSEDEEQTLATSQTMALFKPVVVDGTSTGDEDASSSFNQDSLQAVSGPLRVSTEDIDFPLSDTVSVYEVKDGDTLPDVARLFNVSVNTIIWANNLTSKSITKGDTLIILPITGIKHVVKKSDTITSIARRYKADADDIAVYNGLSVDSTLTLGTTVIVPDGEIEVTQTQKPKSKTKSKTKSSIAGKGRILNFYSYTAPEGFFVRPIVGGRRSQGIHGHNGVDLAATPGTPVLASASGRVIVAKMGGYNGGYGNMIIISHDNGIQTVYAHLRTITISSGQTVSQGQVIGELGNTGRSTGPHLHFEIRGAKNPF